jgi:hypothetical protein
MAVVLNGEISGFKKAMATAKKEMRDVVKVGESMKDVGKSLSMYVTAPLALMGGVAVAAWDKQAKAMAQVENGLRSTGGAAKLTMAELTKAASDLQSKTLFGDEEILQGATTQLLTFTNIAGEQFLRTQEAALDLATKLDGDLKSASIQLGKALNDPVANLSALSRSGIQFSEDQKKVINSLAKTGRLAEAQTIILDELEKQYGGTAAAAAAAGTGGLKQLQNTLGDILEEFGAIIYEGIKPLVEWLKNLAASFQGLSAGTKKTIVIIAALVAAIGPLLAVFGAILTSLPFMVAGFGLFAKAAAAAWAAVLGPIGLVIAGLAAVGVAVYAISKAFPSVATKAKEATQALEEQRKTVSDLESSVRPLVARYEELKSKSKLSQQEQAELEEIVRKIAKAVPGATTEVDKYGRAIDISTGKVTEFVKKNKEMEQALREKALAAKTRELEEYQKKLDHLEKRASKGTSIQINAKTGTGSIGKMSNAEKAKLGEETDALRAKIAQLAEERRKLFLEGQAGMGPFIDPKKVEEDAAKTIGIIQGLQDKLKALQEKKPTLTDEGELAATNRQIKSIQEQIKHYEELGISQSKVGEILKGLNTDFDNATNRFAVFGDSFDVVGTKSKALESAINSLLENGIKPQSSLIQGLKAELDSLGNMDMELLPVPKIEEWRKSFEAVMTATSASVSSSVTSIAKSFEAIPVALKETSAEMRAFLEQQAKDALVYEEIIAGNFGGVGAAIDTLMDKMASAMERLQAQGAIIADFVTTAFSAVGQGLGDMFMGLSSGVDVLHNIGKSLLAAVADFAKKFGEKLVLIGIGENLLLPGSGLPKILAGAALIAAAGIGSALAGGKGAKASPSTGGSSYQAPRPNRDVLKGLNSTGDNTVRFRIEGKDLVAIQEKHSAFTKRFGG